MSPYDPGANGSNGGANPALHWDGMFKDLMLGLGAFGLFLIGAGVLRSIDTHLASNAALVWFFTGLALASLAGIVNVGSDPRRRAPFRVALNVCLLGGLFVALRMMS